MTRHAGATAVVLAVIVTGCGGGPPVDGVDTGNPKAVARAYAEARYRCGDAGAGVQYDLITPKPDFTRQEATRQQQAEGCRPRRVPQVSAVIERQPSDDVAIAGVRIPDDPEHSGPVRLTKTDDGWRVDLGRRLPR